MSLIIQRWAIILAVFFIFLISAILVIGSIFDESYHIEAIRVPESLSEAGYDPITSAFLLQDNVNRITRIGNNSNDVGETETYNNNAEQSNLQVEVSGVGLSPETIAAYIREAFGIRRNTITGEVVRRNNKFRMYLRISGSMVKEIEQEIDSLGETTAFEQLMQKTAEEVMMENNPLLLGMYYNKTLNERAEEAYNYSINRQPERADDAYAFWGEFVEGRSGDTSRALPLIRKALEINPKNKFAFNIWACMRKIEPAQKYQLFRQSIAIDSAWPVNWNDLGFLHYQEHKGNKKEIAKAFEYLQKAQKLSPEYIAPVRNEMLFRLLEGEVEKARECLFKAEFIKKGIMQDSRLAIYAALGDTAQVNHCVRSGKIPRNRATGIMNDIAYSMETSGQNELALKIIRTALKGDSTSLEAAGAFSTLAELLGLKGDKEGFYSNLEKAFKGGLKASEIPLKDKPYASFASMDRFRELQKKYP